MAVLRGGRAVAALVVVLTVLGSGLDASAALGASSRGSGTVSTGTWGAVATTATTPPWPTGSFSAPLRKNAATYFSVVNTGTLALQSAIYSVSAPGAVVTLLACSVPWDQTLGLCSTGAVPVVADVATTQVPTRPGGVLYLQAVGTKNTSLTVDVTLPRTSARPGRSSAS